jgi:uncharacterized protein (TIGR03067 family)
MRNVLILAVAVFAVPDRPDPTPKESSRPLQEQLQGEWVVVQALASGKPLVALKPGEAVFVFAGDRLTIRRPNLENVYEFTIDPKQNPATINIRTAKLAGKDVKGANIAGILKIEGDVLSICLRPSNGFVSDANTKSTLWQVRRK